MKHLITLFLVFTLLLSLGVLSVSAQEDDPLDYEEISHNLNQSLNLQQLYSNLPQDAKATLESMGIGEAGADTLDNVTFATVMNGIYISLKKERKPSDFCEKIR